MTPFEYFKAISTTKEQLITDQQSEAGYVPFIINRSFSYFTDTLFHANEINKLPNLDKKMQYDYFYNAVRKRSRFTKWAKPSKAEDLEAIKQYYKYSDRKALEALSILNEQQIADIKTRLNKGG